MDKKTHALKKILRMALEHPAFDQEGFDDRDYDSLTDQGGDIFDWTIVAILAADALK